MMVVEDKKALKTQLTTRVECKSLVIVIFLRVTLSKVQLIQFYNCKELNRALEVFSVLERDWFLKILRKAY